jgi:hypothetical protein
MVNFDPAFLLGMGLTTHSTEVRGSELPTSGIRQIAPIRGREKETALGETRQSTVSAHAIGLYNLDEDIRGLYQTHSSLKDISDHTGSRFGFLGLFASKQLIYPSRETVAIKAWPNFANRSRLTNHGGG